MSDLLTGCAAALIAGGVASAGVVDIDFSVDGAGDPLANGQALQMDDFQPFFSLSTAGTNEGPAIFDTDNPGPNVGGADPDLLVSLGNALILQSSVAPDMTGGIFDKPNDAASGDGVIELDFTTAVELLSVTLIDINGNNDVMVTLTDTAGLQRVYDVPEKWTNDINTDGPDGFGVLDLTTLAAQTAETSVEATASQDDGFNASSVTQLRFEFAGSGAIDNVRWIPAPGTSFALLALGGLAARRRR